MEDRSDHELVDVLGDGRWLLDPEAMELRPAWDDVRDQNWRWNLRQFDSPSAVLSAVTGVLGHPSRTPVWDDELVLGLLRCLHLILDLDRVVMAKQVSPGLIEGRVATYVRDHLSGY